MASCPPRGRWPGRVAIDRRWPDPRRSPCEDPVDDGHDERPDQIRAPYAVCPGGQTVRAAACLRLSTSTARAPWARYRRYFVGVEGARRLRPRARRALMTLRPPAVAMRTRNPWVRRRAIRLGVESPFFTVLPPFHAGRVRKLPPAWRGPLSGCLSLRPSLIAVVSDVRRVSMRPTGNRSPSTNWVISAGWSGRRRFSLRKSRVS